MTRQRDVLRQQKLAQQDRLATGYRRPIGRRIQQPAQLLRNASIFRGGTWHRSTMFWIHPEDEMTRAIKQRVTYLADLLVSDLAAANGRPGG